MDQLFSAILNGLASFLWSCASWLARHIARTRSRLDARVISVGNIQVGGAGKTPLVAQLAREARQRGFSVCILCRGYGATWETRGGVLAPGESTPEAGECGDEAALLHELAPEAWIGVGADRARQFDAVVRQAGHSIQIVILDDGFQNHRLKKDLEIVALTSASRWKKVFRDFRGALRSADLLVWTKGEVRPKSFGKPLVRVRMELPSLNRELQGTTDRFWLVTGLADGAEAERTARRAGYRIVRHIRFPDHARYAEPMVKGIIDEARAKGCKVAVTGKDWVKWRSFVPAGWKDSRVWVLEPEVLLERDDERIWNQVIWGS